MQKDGGQVEATGRLSFIGATAGLSVCLCVCLWLRQRCHSAMLVQELAVAVI